MNPRWVDNRSFHISSDPYVVHNALTANMPSTHPPRKDGVLMEGLPLETLWRHPSTSPYRGRALLGHSTA